MALEGVTLDQLRTLRAIAESGSFSAAARKLGVVQAAVSQSMERLEAQLRLRLFDRSGRAARLTEQGEAIVAASAGIDREVHRLQEVAASLARGLETHLAIVVDAMFPTDSLVSFAKEFARAHPDVELVVHTEALSAVTDLVRGKRAIFGVAIEDADLRALDRRRVADLHLVPVVAASHPLAHAKGPLDARALDEAVQIVQSERRTEGEEGPAQGVFSRRTWRVVDLATKHALIASGLGFGHMPEHVVREELRSGRLVALDLAAWGARDLRRALVLVSRRDAVLGPVARWAESRLAALCRSTVEHHAT